MERRKPKVFRLRNLLIVLGVAIFAVLAVTVYEVFYMLKRIPEAYAAWDTGTILVEYMKSHEDRWPASWDDLLSVMEGETGGAIVLRGSHAGDIEYARRLRDTVAVDWAFDPARGDGRSPVMRRDGTAFPIVWKGAEPNEMVRAHLMDSARMRPVEAR